MAYDKIIVVRNRLDRCLAYVCNPEKTAHDGTKLITAINCSTANALDEMRATKARWGKTDGIQGYHVIHSYAPGEITPEELSSRLHKDALAPSVIPALRQQKPGHYRLTRRLHVQPRPLRSYRALYVRYLYLLGFRKPAKKHKPIPCPLRAEVAKLEQYKRQFCFLQTYYVDTDSQLDIKKLIVRRDYRIEVEFNVSFEDYKTLVVESDAKGRPVPLGA